MTLESNTRVTHTDVELIFETNLSQGALEEHINVAATLVDDIESAADSSEPARTFEQIEQYLAAHVASAQDPRVTSSSVGDSNFNYLRPSEMTGYWKIAASLDPTGSLKTGTKQVDFETVDSRF